MVPAAGNIINGEGGSEAADIKYFGGEAWCIWWTLVAASVLAVIAVGATVTILVINPVMWEYPFNKTLDVAVMVWSLYQLVVAMRMWKHYVRFHNDVGTITRRIKAIRENRIREKLWDYHVIRTKIWSSTLKDVTKGIHA